MPGTVLCAGNTKQHGKKWPLPHESLGYLTYDSPGLIQLSLQFCEVGTLGPLLDEDTEVALVLGQSIPGWRLDPWDGDVQDGQEQLSIPSTPFPTPWRKKAHPKGVVPIP